MAREPQQGELGGIALIAAGFSLVVMTVGGYIIGYLIDRALHTSPWGAVIGLLLGFFVGIWDIYRIASRVMMSQPLPPAPEAPRSEETGENSADSAGEKNHEAEEE